MVSPRRSCSTPHAIQYICMWKPKREPWVLSWKLRFPAESASLTFLFFVAWDPVGKKNREVAFERGKKTNPVTADPRLRSLWRLPSSNKAFFGVRKKSIGIRSFAKWKNSLKEAYLQFPLSFLQMWKQMMGKQKRGISRFFKFNCHLTQICWSWLARWSPLPLL